MKIIRTLKDVSAMSGRCLLLSKWNPDTILMSIITPILIMLLFACVTGGAMQAGETSYVNLIVPGVILQCLGQYAVIITTIVRSDIKNGIMERFCTVPTKRFSILNRHVWETFIRNIVTAPPALLVAFLTGFRPGTDLLGWCAALLIVSLHILTLSQISVYFGMIVNSPEEVSSFLILAIALPCISSGFVPINIMPGVLQVFVKYQSITPVIDSLRVLFLNESLKTCTLFSVVLWCMALFLLFYILSVRTFKRKGDY